jgi:hypothetical protein
MFVMLSVIMLSVAMLSVVMLNVVGAGKITCTVVNCMHGPMPCFQNALAYFATAVSYEGKMFMKLPPVENVLNLFLSSMMMIRHGKLLCLPFSDSLYQGILTKGIRTVDLVIKVACFVNKLNNIFKIKRSTSKLGTIRR